MVDLNIKAAQVSNEVIYYYYFATQQHVGAQCESVGWGGNTIYRSSLYGRQIANSSSS